MLSKLTLIKRYKVVVTPLVTLILILFSWEYLLSLFSIPLASLLLMLLLGGGSLWANSLIIKRVTSRYRKFVSVRDSLWMTSVGVLGNSLGLPVGTGVKYYFWVVQVGLKVRQSLLGVGYFSLFSFLLSSLVVLVLSAVSSGSSALYLIACGVVAISGLLVWGVSRAIFKVDDLEVVLDFGLVVVVIALMAFLFSLPLAFYYPNIELFDIVIVSFGFIALSYLTFVSSIPVGQELLLGLVAMFFNDQFMLGVAVGLAVRMVYVLNAAAVVLLLKPSIRV